MSFKPYTEKIKQKKIGICSILGRIQIWSGSRTRPGSGSVIPEADPYHFDPDPKHWRTHPTKIPYNTVHFREKNTVHTVHSPVYLYHTYQKKNSVPITYTHKILRAFKKIVPQGSRKKSSSLNARTIKEKITFFWTFFFQRSNDPMAIKKFKESVQGGLAKTPTLTRCSASFKKEKKGEEKSMF